MKDEDLHELFSNPRNSLEASHGRRWTLHVLEALVKTGTPSVAIREVEAEPASDAAPYSRQALSVASAQRSQSRRRGSILALGEPLPTWPSRTVNCPRSAWVLEYWCQSGPCLNSWLVGARRRHPERRSVNRPPQSRNRT